MSGPPRSGAPAPWLIGGGVVLVLAGLVVGGGNPLVAVGPVLGLLGLYLIWRAPLRTTLFVLTFLALFLDNPGEIPHAGMWRSPLHPLGKLLYSNLSSSLGIGPLRFSALEALLLFLLGIVAYRRATKSRIDPPAVPTPKPLRALLLLSFVTLLGMEAWGIVRGGNVKESFWQFRVLLSVPMIAYLFSHALVGIEDARRFGRVVVGAAVWKVFWGAFFYFVIAKRQGLMPPYVTTHTDTVLFVVAVVIMVALWWEKPSWPTTLRLGIVVPILFVGLVLNDRRLAYVTLIACLLMIFLISPWNRAKRLLTRAVILGLPVILAYVAVGWGSTAGAFKPVRAIRSIVTSDTGTVQDTSTEFRDQENFNLVFTWQRNPILGSGFGHEYFEVLTLADISSFMPNFRYLPHNSVLWLWSVGGYVGFTCLWLYLAAVVFFAARAYHRAHRPLDRTAMLVTIAAVIAYLNQAFGDMGVVSYTPVFILAPAIALAGKLAIQVGAWRDPVRAPAVAPVPRASARAVSS